MRFSFVRSPRLEFGPGALSVLPRLLAEGEASGPTLSLVVLVTGGSSFRQSSQHDALVSSLGERREVLEFSCRGEPSPEFVDACTAAAVARLSAKGGGCAVVGVGGGSAMDAGKAVAAMIPGSLRAAAAGLRAPSVEEYLEGVGTMAPEGLTVPYIAVPTTAGTGSEATKNAVISRVGQGSGQRGFKKSLRHDAYCPAIAVVDPELALGCPRAVTAASGLDALTQLLEAYLSPTASPIVDALCESGLSAFSRSFERVLSDGADLEARTGMAYAAYLSGVALANAGLGSVHALASPVGGRFPAPHGVVCALLLGPATELNVELLRRASEPGGRVQPRAAEVALGKYARAAELLAPGARVPLLDSLRRLVAAASLPGLSSYGITREDLESLAAAAATKTNPVPLEAREYKGLLAAAL